MAVLASVKVEDFHSAEVYDALQANFIALGLTEYPEESELKQLIRGAVKDGACIDAIVKKGIKGKDPIDGEIHWQVKCFEPGFAVDERTGRINFEILNQSMFVKNGQLIAIATKPVNGEDGLDVFGNKFPAVKAKKAEIEAGRNVEVEEKKDGFYYKATTDGRIQWANEKLIVEDKIVNFNEDVTVDTEFEEPPGSLSVTGSVIEGASLTLPGDLIITGTLENVKVDVGGNLQVQGGIIGDEKNPQMLKVAGSVHAKYILNAKIEAGGDVVVENEIQHSDVKTRGALIMGGGRVIGGNIIARSGITVGATGSEGGVATELYSAVDFYLPVELKSFKDQIKDLEEEIKKINKDVKELNIYGKNMSHEQRETLTELYLQRDEHEFTIEELQEKVMEKQKSSRKKLVPQINVNRMIYPKTSLKISKYSASTGREIEGPLKAALKPGGIKLVKIKKEGN